MRHSGHGRHTDFVSKASTSLAFSDLFAASSMETGASAGFGLCRVSPDSVAFVGLGLSALS